MEQSPLELYETAYKLHYVENRISESLLYYQKLIEVFPESNECGYASIQIQKIKAENLAHEFKKAGKILHPVSIVAFIVGLLSLLLSGAFGFLLNKKITIESKKSSLAVNALGKMLNGEDEEALKILAELKIISGHDITPFELTSEVMKKRNAYREAREEYALFFELNPKVQPNKYQNVSMQKLDVLIYATENKKGMSKKTGLSPLVLVSQKKIEHSTPVLVESRNSDQSRIKQKTEHVQKRPVNPVMAKTDSISYF